MFYWFLLMIYKLCSHLVTLTPYFSQHLVVSSSSVVDMVFAGVVEFVLFCAAS